MDEPKQPNKYLSCALEPFLNNLDLKSLWLSEAQRNKLVIENPEHLKWLENHFDTQLDYYGAKIEEALKMTLVKEYKDTSRVEHRYRWLSPQEISRKEFEYDIV